MSDYRVVVADWALGANGQPGDVIALEHVKDDGTLCLVHSTTLPLHLDELQQLAMRHDYIHGNQPPVAPDRA